jgi:curved DNA-binding protein CbpA
MGNTPSSNNNSNNSNNNSNNRNVNLYDQYINEQKRIIAAQQEQINNLSRMNISQNTINNNIPPNILLQQMNTNQNNMQQPVGSTNNVNNQQIPQLPQITGPDTQSKLNPYKILGIGKNFDEKSLKRAYLKKAMVSHPDRGGSPVEFQKVSIAYTLLLKKITDKNNNHLHNDLRDNSKSYMSGQTSDNKMNTKMTDQFDANLFNKIYNDNKIDGVYDRGYGDWMEENNNNKLLEQPKMFNKSFNKDLFNHEFNKYKSQQQKQMSNSGQIVQYDEPQVDISMRGKDSLMVLGQDNISDFSGQSEGGLNFRDYKDAFTNSCLIDESSVDINNRFDNINSMKSSRTNINYKMSSEDLRKQELMKIKMERDEQKRLQRLTNTDNQAFNIYEQIHDRMLQR